MQVSRVKPEEWHLHRFRDTVATRWLLEPSKETQEQLDRMKLPFYEPVCDTDTLRVLGAVVVSVNTFVV